MTPVEHRQGQPTVRLLLEHGAALRRYLTVLGCSADRVEDVLQESLLVALRGAFEYRSRGEAAAFLRRTAYNVFHQQLRDDRRRCEVEIADEEYRRQCGDDGGAGYLAALRGCLEQLPPNKRLLVDGAYRDGLGRSALGQLVDMRTAGVKTALRRVRQQLRECVERKREKR